MLKIGALILLSLWSVKVWSQESVYQKDLNVAIQLYLSKSIIPDSLLIKLVPQNQEEFHQLYATTSSRDKIINANFFYDLTSQIFDKVVVEKQNLFYLPCLQLASFADGEFGEAFTISLEKIIKLDRDKFCQSVKGKKYAAYNPVKYYLEQNNCK